MKDFLNISDKPYLLDPNIQSEDIRSLCFARLY